MSHLDDLPRRDPNHEIEEKAIIAFQQRLSDCGAFIRQHVDRKDYGTDYQLEVVDQEQATNVRVHVQLKGTGRELNADGSVSVQVQRTNLNYLLMHPYSFYACYHVPTGSLRICTAEKLVRQYEHDGKSWTDQQTLTASFAEELTIERLQKLAELARSGARSSRDRRIEQTKANPADVPGRIRSAVPDFHVPEDSDLAFEILRKLHEKGADDVISDAFDKFVAVVGNNSAAIALCYMAEINLGMARPGQYPQRIEDAIRHFRSKLGVSGYHAGGLHYTIGNAFSALGNEQEAKLAYEAALADPATTALTDLAAQAHKNLGTSFERLGDEEKAVEHYREALRLNPDLPEAHNAMGNYYVREGRYRDALTHLDRVVFTEQSLGKTSAVAGWRANVLFNLGDGPAAFREINSLVAQADSLRWVWPWCARLVASFGRTSMDNALQSITFWQRYIRAHPEESPARRELLLTTFYLHSEGRDVGKTYAEFREEFDRHIAHVDPDDAALPWDRLGHWAQSEGDWQEAERCFRKAYDLKGGHYGYCLGTALNSLDRFEESVPILREQAEVLQPDAMSWFQLGVAYGNLGRAPDAIDAYQKAIALDPEYAVSIFNLGGTYWNGGDRIKAVEIWKDAATRFPDHELTDVLRRDFPFLFDDTSLR